MHEYSSSKHAVNPPLVLSSKPQYSKKNSELSFNGRKNYEAKNNEDEEYYEVQYLIDEDTSSASTSMDQVSTSASTASSPASKTPRPKRKKSESEILKFLKKDAKRQKKDTGHFFKMMSAFGASQNINLPVYNSSSSESE